MWKKLSFHQYGGEVVPFGQAYLRQLRAALHLVLTSPPGQQQLAPTRLYDEGVWGLTLYLGAIKALFNVR